MFFNQPARTLIEQRFSSRSYLGKPIAADLRRRLADLLATLTCGPLGTPARFVLIAATEQEGAALRSLGTYGFIKNPAGFMIGVVQKGARNLEDFGYLMEQAVLLATDLGLGTCWLGGSFTRSSFTQKISAQATEVLPAVTAVGYSASRDRSGDVIRRQVGADTRLPWEALFYHERFGSPLPRETAGAYAAPLEGMRLGPSASNKQPWRIVRAGDAWHFYVQRTKGYRDNLGARLLGLADLQRVDIGIAMCHFELTARELGLAGQWTVRQPSLPAPDDTVEYIVTWAGRDDADTSMSSRSSGPNARRSTST